MKKIYILGAVSGVIILGIGLYFVSRKGVDVTVKPESTLTLTANGTPGAITVNSGATVTISWTGSNLNTNIVGTTSGDWANQTKSCSNTTDAQFSPVNTSSSPITKTYTLTCTGLNGVAVSSTVSVTTNPAVNTGTNPTITLTANGTPGSITISSGTPVTISWTGSNLNTNIMGTASGSWGTSTKSCVNTTGTPFSISNTSVGSVTRTYKLSCTGTNGATVSSTVSVISNLVYVPPTVPTLVLKVKDTSTNTVSAGTSTTSGNPGSPLTGGVATITINSGDTIHLSSTGSNLTDLSHGFPDAGDTAAWTNGGNSYKTCPGSLTTPTDYSPDFLLTNTTSSPIINHYTLRCHYTTSLFISSKVDVTVNPEPTLTLTANGTPVSITVNSGDPVTISWTGTSLNTNIAGTASGAWGTGTKSCADTTGTSFSITNTGTTPITRTYTLTCTGLNGTTVSSTVSVTSNYVPPPTPTLTFYIKDNNTTTVSSSSSNSPASITINSGDTIHLSSTGSNLTQLAFGVPAGDDSTNWSTGTDYKTCPSSTTTPTNYSPDFSLTNTTSSAIIKKYILRCHTTADTSTYISREVDVTVNPEPNPV